jgi:UDP-N-acetylglucosamine--N-acetylmuramyl-(pentapeptide) pyrophosphoryl-undecaprenol N-acetylglucosamine transferase
MSFLIAAAGTGGHVFPGLAVAEALVQKGVSQDAIVFVGGERLESEVYPAAGFDLEQFEIAGLKRVLARSNLALPGIVRRASAGIARLMRDRAIAVTLGFGGYVTLPTAIAALRTRTPLLVSEQNAEAGLANRVASRWARRSFGAFPTTKGLRRGEWVGNPIRATLAEFDRTALRADARATYGIDPGAVVVGVMGGSLGAGLLNRVAALLAERVPAYTILNLSGPAHVTTQQELAERSEANWIVRGFEPNMELFYAAIDLVVARAGGVVAEYTATATPAVLIPGTFGSAGHQVANAQALAAAGAAVVLAEQDISRAADVVEAALNRRAQLIIGTKALARPQAAATIAQAMLEAAR